MFLNRILPTHLALVALLGTLVVVLPATAPPAEAATTRPAPSDSLPPCIEVDGVEKGACSPLGSAVGITAGGVFGSDGATVEVRLSPGVAICDSWPFRSTWNPSPCWANASISVGSPVHLNDAGDDLVGSGSIFTRDGGGSYSILQESVRASTWDASTSVASSCGATRSAFGTFIYGGHAQQARWADIGNHALQCTLTWDGDRPDDLQGSTWIPITGSLSVKTNGDAFGSPASATTWVRVDGDMSNPGPEAAFTYEQSADGIRLVNESSHPWDLPMTYEWSYPDGSGSTATDPVVDLPPGQHWLRLTATDVDGLKDSLWGPVDVSTDELAVTLSRPDDGDIEVGDDFVVVLTVRSPLDNGGDLTGVQRDGPLLELPAWLELVAGEMPTGFDLTPGSERSATLTLRATGPGTDTVASRWTGTDEGGTQVVGTGELPLTVPGSLAGDWFRTDPASQGVKEDETAPLRLRVDNITGRDLTEVELVEVEVAGIGETPGEALLAEATVEHEGEAVLERLADQLAADGPASVGFQDYTLKGVAEGDLVLRALVRGTDPDGNVVEGTIEEEWTVRSTNLTIEITFDPEERVQPESDDPEAPPEPVDMTATVTLTNTSGGPLTDITIAEFEVSRLIGEQQLWLEQVGGQRLTNWDAPGILLEEPTGTDAPLEPFDLDNGDERVFTADFVVRDDGQLDFHVLALAADEADQTVRGYGENSWVLTPEKYLEVTAQVVSTQPVPAGQDVIISGRIVNLSQTATLEVGPLIPIPSGNTGTLSLAYGGGPAPDPSLLPGIPPPLVLGPGDSELFEVAVSTNYSDPRSNVSTGEPEVALTGGTRAYFEFVPWAIATEADGTIRTVRTDPQTDQDRGVKISDEHRELTASINDSIAIPETEWDMLAGGISIGVVKGIGRAGVGLITGAVDALKLPFTLTIGAMEYQSRVWNAFTEEERRLYSEEFSTYLVAMAVGNVENGLRDADQLKDDLNEMVYQEMTRLADEWETGDYVSTAEAYAAGGSEIAASLWLPAAMTKLAQAPRAAAALERAQLAVNARMGPVFAEMRAIQYVEDALPLLQALENGAEIPADAMRRMYGVAPEEVAELQRLAERYEVLITFRSRHPSSVAWMERFGAMMKPEAIKIKSVSDLDTALGYRLGDVGSVVFRKPDVLRSPPGPGVSFEDHIRSYVTGRGFTPGTRDYDSAVDRVVLRVREWHKHEAAYRNYDQRGWIATEFNYESNAIRNTGVETSGQRQTGFNLREVGPDEFVVELLDPSTGTFRRVTGDIDPIAFTNLDGSPLTQSQHRDLINEMRDSAVLRAQHPESATFTGMVGDRRVAEPGLDFIESQFKPNEAAAQIGPTGPARAVRLNKGASRWDSAADYNLVWEGGYRHVGGRGTIRQQTDFDPDLGRRTDIEVPVDLDFKPIQLGEFGEAGLGRATVIAVKTGTGTAVFIGQDGRLVEVNRDGTTQPYPGSAELFEEGEPVTLRIAPAGQVESTMTGTQAAPSVTLSATGPHLASASASQTDGVVLVDDGAPVLFEPGQIVAVIDPRDQNGQGELRTVASVDGWELRFTEAVEVAVDDIVIMVEPAPTASGDLTDAPVVPGGSEDPTDDAGPRGPDDPVPGDSDADDQPGTIAPDSDVGDEDGLPASDVLGSEVSAEDEQPAADALGSQASETDERQPTASPAGRRLCSRPREREPAARRGCWRGRPRSSPSVSCCSACHGFATGSGRSGTGPRRAPGRDAQARRGLYDGSDRPPVHDQGGSDRRNPRVRHRGTAAVHRVVAPTPGRHGVCSRPCAPR